MKIVFVSYYTPAYTPYATLLRESLDRHGLTHDIRPIADKGGFLPNVRYKPSFLLDMLKKHPEADAIVWVDADGIVQERPSLLFKIKQDLAVRFMSWPKKNKEELLSGTVFLANRPRVHRMMAQWIEALRDAPETYLKPEQQVLQEILPRLKISLYRLPEEYCCIHRQTMNVNPVIEHFQASRTHRYGGKHRYAPPPGRTGRKGFRRSRVAAPIGGVRGYKNFSNVDANRMVGDLKKLPSAKVFDGCLRGQTVIVMGNSPSIGTYDASFYKAYPVIGCNRALKPPADPKYPVIRPDYLIMGDREPYCQERDEGRLKKAAAQGTKMIFTRSLFDPNILLRGPYDNVYRRAQPVPDFGCYLYHIDSKISPAPNFDTFARPFNSFKNVCGSLIQAAACMKAKRVFFIGIELKWWGDKSHHFGDGSAVGAYEQRKSIPTTQGYLRQAKQMFKDLRVEVRNLSPIKDCPFAEVFGNASPAGV